ncbi:MAG: 2-succinyl-5-enolpyruvyl-6-hydroxy-3-cyclohexene-1-carboxylic-acid synthase [Microbacteriaceae bacterium]|nr:2-succinyl-5-enolpyruvyl-6-hydroxy-3-cyclohexene-1-carboxylic-acid synthase [Microbacteriaceae bacterium]
MSQSSPATDFSVELLGAFVTLGVRHVVLCPGARSQALALAAAQFERAGLIELSVRIDERVAGFLALGLALESRIPVLIVTTSGTAVANLHPAVLEAHHSGVPLIVLSADRPTELRGIGSNQTTDQPGMFGSAVNFVRDVAAPTPAGFAIEYPSELAQEAFSAAAGHSAAPGYSTAPGPVQLNLAFREPLSSAASRVVPPVFAGSIAAGAAEAAAASVASAELLLDAMPGTIVIAGHGAGSRAEAFARALGVPLIAEVSSGARFGPNLVVAYRQLLRDDAFGAQVRRVVVFGHPTLSREIPALLQRDDVAVIVVRGPGFEAYNPGHRAQHIVGSVSVGGSPAVGSPAVGSHPIGSPPVGTYPIGTAERAWLGSWVHTSRNILAAEIDRQSDSYEPSQGEALAPEAFEARDSGANAHGENSLGAAKTDDRAVRREKAAFALAQMGVFRQTVTRTMLVAAVWSVTWPHDRLIFGASRLIREADQVLPGKKITVHANRGLAGIDGTIATSAGIALASEAAGSIGVTRVLLGDLTLLHDVGALLFGIGERRPRLQVIVGNDGGGTIFDSLEVAHTADAESINRVLYTPHAVDVKSLASAYGWNYHRATNRGELDEALSSVDGTTIIEVPLAR